MRDDATILIDCETYLALYFAAKGISIRNKEGKYYNLL